MQFDENVQFFLYKGKQLGLTEQEFLMEFYCGKKNIFYSV